MVQCCKYCTPFHSILVDQDQCRADIQNLHPGGQGCHIQGYELAFLPHMFVSSVTMSTKNPNFHEWVLLEIL